MPNVIVTSLGESIDSPVDSHFGRCKYLLVCDSAKPEVIKVIANLNADAASGVGVTTSQLVADEGIKSIITGNIGPKAFQVLEPAGIDVYIAETGTVKEALLALTDGALKKVTAASTPAHTGLGQGKK